ncbi:MAG: hypothetical protein A4E65_01904 [Syntrophorhabdus sp. PtaU1.Bin153]|nr:MAG: hypothetical protein A4E65_01904 [Syntrophorhabdus sp. PtaU1.Bin153]
MEACNKVIFLKTIDRVLRDVVPDAKPQDIPSPAEEETMIEKARKVLDQMEEDWENDHGTIELRDRFHLLRYYLDRLPRR